jgi:hypothetical protein
MTREEQLDALQQAGVTHSAGGKKIENLTDWELGMEVRLLVHGKRECGCPANTDYRTVNRNNRSMRSEAGHPDTVTVCSSCGDVIEL